MQDGARFFAYSTWAAMISLGIMIFTHQFLYLTDVSISAMFIWGAVFGALYFNLTYTAIKRYIKKVPAPTHTHMLLAFLIFCPPAFWLIVVGDFLYERDILILLFLVVGVYLGMQIGNKQGIKARYEYIQKLKQAQQAPQKNG